MMAHLPETSSWLGRLSRRRVQKETPKGVYVETPEGDAFLPKAEFGSLSPAPGDELQVLIYHDYDGYLSATLRTPLIQVGEFALLRIKAAGGKGAFADWGLEKDLFIPHAEQLTPLEKGGHYLVYAYIDGRSGRITGSTRVDRFAPDVLPETHHFAPGQAVPLLISRKTDLGYKAIIETEPPYSGTLYQNELLKKIRPGMRLTGYIKQVREDLKLDLTLRRPGYDEVRAAAEELQERLEETKDGFLPYHDKSDAELIRHEFNISKRSFKAAVGALLKQGIINIEPGGIRLNRSRR
ncbi:MAG: S1 RNA-binding domain-containing protein [Cyclonatronaceae bacterium]